MSCADCPCTPVVQHLASPAGIAPASGGPLARSEQCRSRDGLRVVSLATLCGITCVAYRE